MREREGRERGERRGKRGQIQEKIEESKEKEVEEETRRETGRVRRDQNLYMLIWFFMRSSCYTSPPFMVDKKEGVRTNVISNG